MNGVDAYGVTTKKVDIKAEGRGDGRDDLRNQPVPVSKARLCDVGAIPADIYVDSFIVNPTSHDLSCHRRRNRTPKTTN